MLPHWGGRRAARAAAKCEQQRWVQPCRRPPGAPRKTLTNQRCGPSPCSRPPPPAWRPRCCPVCWPGPGRGPAWPPSPARPQPASWGTRTSWSTPSTTNSWRRGPNCMGVFSSCAWSTRRCEQEAGGGGRGCRGRAPTLVPGGRVRQPRPPTPHARPALRPSLPGCRCHRPARRRPPGGARPRGEAGGGVGAARGRASGLAGTHPGPSPQPTLPNQTLLD